MEAAVPEKQIRFFSHRIMIVGHSQTGEEIIVLLTYIPRACAARITYTGRNIMSTLIHAQTLSKFKYI